MKLHLKWVSWKCVILTLEKNILELLQFSLFHPRHCVLLRSTSCLLLPDDQAGNDGIIGIMTNTVFLITTKVLFFHDDKDDNFQNAKEDVFDNGKDNAFDDVIDKDLLSWRSSSLPTLSSSAFLSI